MFRGSAISAQKIGVGLITITLGILHLHKVSKSLKILLRIENMLVYCLVLFRVLFDNVIYDFFN
jgi:hypothetical protein